MKIVLVAFCVAVASALPQQQQYDSDQYNQGEESNPQETRRQQKPHVPIVSLDSNVNHDGTYRYSFEGGDGTRAEQSGQLKTIGNEAGEVSQGSYSYVGDDGKTYSLSYTADETGYHPVGDHLPQSPPIPEAILRSLEHLATAPPPPKDDHRHY